jgi:tRNA-2-methylthio-N6-dimethylallyladenosine synthase
VYIETYGCQMNLADTELVNGILHSSGYSVNNRIEDADVILLNTCSVRDHAEAKIYQRLNDLKKYKLNKPSVLIGVIGCMAERLRADLLDNKKLLDFITGPDEYRKLPAILEKVHETGERGIAVRLSRVETYEDITPLRKEGISAWLAVMRGCDKFCSFCVVPYTRGRERSRSLESIISEVIQLRNDGFREVTLLGQNVNSYKSGEYDFADLLKSCALAVPEMRIRFTTSHPQDLSIKLLETIAAHENICSYIHLPVQSGSDRILELMKRNYTIEHYLNLIKKTREIITDVSLSTDIISGFPGETEEDHKMTLDVMREVRYDGAYMFKYSPREKTKAFDLKDNIDDNVKSQRLKEIIDLQTQVSLRRNLQMVGKKYEILIESLSKKSDQMYSGRTDGNKSVIIPVNGFRIGDKVKVKIIRANSATLFGELARD